MRYEKIPEIILTENMEAQWPFSHRKGRTIVSLKMCLSQVTSTKADDFLVSNSVRPVLKLN